MAVANYHAANKCLPPAYIADEQGKPMHSWRVLLLPYMEERELYKAYRFDEPWNGPNNIQLANKAPPVYRLPGAPADSVTTAYLAVVGPETAWPGAKIVGYGNITDGTSNTVLIVESARSDINWLEPRDLDFATMSFVVGEDISCENRDGANLGMADGSAQLVMREHNTEIPRGLFTIAGGEEDVLRW